MRSTHPPEELWTGLVLMYKYEGTYLLCTLGGYIMGWTVGIPSLKLNNIGAKSKHCGNFRSVAAEALKERKGHDPDINPALTVKNKYIGFSSAAELEAYSNAHLEQLRDAKGRVLRKDAVVMCVTIFKPPAALMDTLSEQDQHRLLEDGTAKIRQIIGKDNVKAEAWHFDEQGGHVHMFWEPITEDGRLCAKERHNLQFLSRLNREIPEYLRARGWDIDNCNAYDAAMDKMEKAQRRQKNGRSSAVYKADAEKQLSYINAKIEETYDIVGNSARNFGRIARENVAFESLNVYDNIIYLMSECDDTRFEELDREGLELKKKHLEAKLGEENIPKKLEDIINSAQVLSWTDRQKFWDDYRQQSNTFWKVRAFLKEEYRKELIVVYDKRYDTLWSYYQTMYCLQSTRSLCLMIIYTIKALLILSETNSLNDQITILRRERDDLIKNTASFKKYSKVYVEQLKAGRVPFCNYLRTMERIVVTMDKKAQENVKFQLQKEQTYILER